MPQIIKTPVYQGFQKNVVFVPDGNLSPRGTPRPKLEREREREREILNSEFGIRNSELRIQNYPH
jgi:hypothetical protein